LKDVAEAKEEAAKDKARQLASSLQSEIEAGRRALSSLNQALNSLTLLMADYESAANRLNAATSKLVREREEQVRAYDALVGSLEKSGSIFEPYQSNPEPLPGESRITMRHGDSFQVFGLAPWNGIAFRINGATGANTGLENLIPILDVFGLRLQWSDTRFSEVRAATGVMFFRDTEYDEDQGTTEEVFNWAFHTNVSVANFKLGVAVAPWSNQRTPAGEFAEKLRVVVGADLIKIISGETVEAL